MAWVKPAFSPPEVNQAANILMSKLYMPFDEWNFDEWTAYDEALVVVNNWRAAHGHPLNTFQTNLRLAARRIDSSATVAQRIKRLKSITDKLDKFPRMKLTQMQDIGGCRAILGSIKDVGDLVRYYEHVSAIKHPLASKDDYISTPKPSGYRGIHFVYRYFSDKDKTKIYNGLKIEMQIRSQNQHAWATAVETVGTFVGEALKSSVGPEQWLRFFQLMGTAIALREHTPPVPGTPDTLPTLIAEISELARELEVDKRLRAYGNTLRTLEEGAGASDKYYLLQLNVSTEELSVQGFKQGEIEKASKLYVDAEKAAKGSPKHDAVLVSVDSLAALPKAYPNYFADTRVFLELLSQTLSGRPRRIHMKDLRRTSA